MTANTHAFVTNTVTGETTRYDNYAFDHVVKFNGAYYGVQSDGIYLLEGATDDGDSIDARFRTAKSDFGSPMLKRVPYLFVDTDDTTQVTPYTDGTQGLTYQSNYAGKRTKMPRGLLARYWAFEFSGFGGGPVRIKGFEIEPEVMTRRIS